MPQILGQELPSILISFFRTCVWLIILVVVFAPLERLFAARPKRVLRAGIFADLGYYFLNSLLTALLLSFPLGVLAMATRKAVPADFLAFTATLPLTAKIICGLVAGEVGYYWGHRWCHEIPILWRFHSIHHSAREMDFLVNSRAHPVDMVFGRLCGLVPIYVLGLGGPVGGEGTIVPVIVGLIGTFWGFFIHANLSWRYGPLERLISTPAFHHWHHTQSGPVNKNYSATLPWIDSIFGSYFLPKDSLPTKYGILSTMPDALVDQLVHPFFPPQTTSLFSETDSNNSFRNNQVAKSGQPADE